MKKFLTTVLICCLLFSILYSRPAAAGLVYVESFCKIDCTFEYGYENGSLYCYYHFDVLGPEYLSKLYLAVLGDSSSISRYTLVSSSSSFYNVENVYDSSGNVTNTIYTLRALYTEGLYDSIYGSVRYTFDGETYSQDIYFEGLNDIPEKPTETITPTPEPTETPTPTPEPTETPTPTSEPTETPTPSPEPTETPTPTPELTETPTPSPEPTETPTPSLTPTIGPEMILDVTLNENIATVDYCTGGYTPVLSYIELYEIAGYEMLLECDQFTFGTGTRTDTLQAGKTYRYKLTYTFDDNGSRYTRELWSNDIYISDPELEDFQQNGKIYNFRTLIIYVWDNVMSVKFPIEGFQIEWKTIFIWTLIAGGLIWFIKKVI